jgi:6-phosphofructokinase
MGFPVVGVPSTIDNDLPGSDITIGVDTALNIALEAMDRLRVTASSHQRAFLVEVMGRNCGYLALMAGIAGGAEAIVIPEVETDPEQVVAELRSAYERGKAHGLVVVAEGARYNAAALVKHFEEHRARLGFELRATTLGHVQRGGAPGAFDRLLATRLGAAAVDLITQGRHGVLVGFLHGQPDPDAARAGRLIEKRARCGRGQRQTRKSNTGLPLRFDGRSAFVLANVAAHARSPSRRTSSVTSKCSSPGDGASPIWRA